MGQVNIDTRFGAFLYELASNKEYKTFVDVGSWNGQGTTKCLLSGILQNNPDAKLYSLEANQIMYQKAKDYWADKCSQLILLNGSLHRELLTLEEIESHPKFYKFAEHGDKYKTWLQNDRNDMNLSSLIVIPDETVDVIVIDGGEFSGMGDWKVLKAKNPKVVCLDDSNVIKTYFIREELLNDKWEVIADDQDDRNGYCIFKRR